MGAVVEVGAVVATGGGATGAWVEVGAADDWQAASTIARIASEAINQAGFTFDLACDWVIIYLFLQLEFEILNKYT